MPKPRSLVEREAIYELVGLTQFDSHLTQFDSPYTPRKRLANGDLTEVLARLLELDDKAVMRVMAFAMAESFHLCCAC